MREAGYIPLPRLWVTPDQMEMIQYMARQNADEVNRIRADAHRDEEGEKDEAWKQHRESGGG